MRLGHDRHACATLTTSDDVGMLALQRGRKTRRCYRSTTSGRAGEQPGMRHRRPRHDDGRRSGAVEGRIVEVWLVEVWLVDVGSVQDRCVELCGIEVSSGGGRACVEARGEDPGRRSGVGQLLRHSPLPGEPVEDICHITSVIRSSDTPACG